MAGSAPVRRVDVVDGLRGIAILLVVLFHYWQLSFWAFRIPDLPGADLEFVQVAGFLGVEVFFFISAFCLFQPHARAMCGTGAVPTLSHFAYRRAIKILPSYLLALVVLGLWVPDIYPVGVGVGIPTDVALHLTFLHDLLPETRGSFAGVLWSLAVEVQFYCVFPLLARAFRRRPWWTAAVMIGVAVAFRAWARQGPLGDFLLRDSLLPGFLDLFALGMLAAYLVVWIGQRPAAARRLGPAFTVAAVAAAGALLVLFRWIYDVRSDAPAEVWQSLNRQYVGLVLLGLTTASAFALPAWRRLLTNRLLVFLSTISYNLYIWHQVVGRLVRDRGWWPARTAVPTDDLGWQWSYTIVAVAASVAVASAITYGFKRPLLRRGVRGVVRALRDRMPGRGSAPRGDRSPGRYETGGGAVGDGDLTGAGHLVPTAQAVVQYPVDDRGAAAVEGR